MKFAVKLLSQSDLSFFKVHLERSKQKAINLNRIVFVDGVYPGLSGVYKEVAVALALFGPGGRAPHRLRRKVIRDYSYKNWRLNGEFVDNPADDPDRYGALAQGDFAVFGFSATVEPDQIDVALVSAAEDPELHQIIEQSTDLTAGVGSMAEIPLSVVSDWQTRTAARYGAQHPLEFVSFTDSVEDVLFGAPGTPGGTRAITPDELARQLEQAATTGRQGEAFFAAWLRQEMGEDGFEWTSQTFARAPYDFILAAAPWETDAVGPVHVDVKATKGDFGRPIHLSIAELRFAARTPQYFVARLSSLDHEPRVTILGGVAGIAASILAKLHEFPKGVQCDSVSLDPVELSVVRTVLIDLED